MVFAEFFTKTYRFIVSYVELVYGNGSAIQMVPEAEMHRALTIPEIREHILQFCSRKTLKACRLVSKDWRDSSSKSLSSKTKIILESGIQMSDFVDFVKTKDVNRKLYVNFAISGSLQYHKLAIKEFWRICGENVRILELSQCEFASSDDFRAVLFQRCPNMQQLSLQGISVYMIPLLRNVVEPEEWVEPTFGQHTNLKSLTVDGKASNHTGISWMQYFSYFSSMEILRMQCDLDVDPDMFRALNTIRNRDPTKLPLKELRICYRGSASIVNRLHVMNPVDMVRVLLDPSLHLESLVMCVSTEIAHEIKDHHAKFSEILGAHGSSLKSVELNCNYRNPFPLAPFSAELDTFPGQFENLSQASFMSTSISSLNFLKFTPNVRQLLIKHDLRRPESTIIESTDFAGMGNLRLTKLEKLELNFDENVTTETLQLLMNL